MQLRGLLAVAVAIGSVSLLNPSAQATSHEPDRVSLDHPVASLRSVLDELETKEEKLQLSKPLKSVKMRAMVNGIPRERMLEAIAHLYGSEWKEISTGKPRILELRRTPDVERWLEAWKRAHWLAEQEVRDLQRQQVRKSMASALQAAEKGGSTETVGLGPLSLIHFLRALPASDLDILVEHIARSSPLRDGGESEPRVSPIVRRFSQLTPPQQRHLRDWVQGQPTGETSLLTRRLGALQGAVVEVGSKDAVGVDVALHWPTGDRMNGYAFSGTLSPTGLDFYLHQALFRHLSRTKTPPWALVGASITDKGRVEAPMGLVDVASPLFRLAEPVAAARPFVLAGAPIAEKDRLTQNDPLSVEFLPFAARQMGLNLLADYHTRSDRLHLSGDGSVGSVLTAAAQSYGMAFRQDGDLLLARSFWWPRRDPAEPPAPHTERWIAIKRARQSLSLDDLMLMGQLPEECLDSLAAYQDGQAAFRNEVRVVRRNRWVWAVARRLTGKQRQEAFSPQGVRLSQLDLATKALVVRSVSITAPPDQVVLRLLKTPEFRSVAEGYQAQLVHLGSGTALWTSSN